MTFRALPNNLLDRKITRIQLGLRIKKKTSHQYVKNEIAVKERGRVLLDVLLIELRVSQGQEIGK